MKKKNKLLRKWASLALSFLLSGCAVQIPNTKFCSVAGVVEAGMDCFHTLSEEEEVIPALEIKNFLESQVEIKDPKTGLVLQEAHGAAICQSSEDWSAEHTALEAACQKLGAACTYDIKKIINSVNDKVESLQKPKR